MHLIRFLVLSTTLLVSSGRLSNCVARPDTCLAIYGH